MQMRVRFIGNSQMGACDLPRMVQVLLESAPCGWSAH